MLRELDHVDLTPSPPAPSAVLPLANLLNDLDDLLELLEASVKNRSWLDAFLLAAGANQIVDDHLHEGTMWFERVGRHLGRTAHGRLGLALGVAVARIADARQVVGRLSSAHRRARAWRARISPVVDRLAAGVADPSTAPYDVEPAVVLLRREAIGLGLRLRRSVVRLPSCFRNFDQHPDDLVALTADFCERWPDRARPVVVVGVRTSGSYTGPLHAAMLRLRGWTDVQLITFRPGQRWDAAD